MYTTTKKVPCQLFLFLVEMSLHYVAQADLKLLNSGNSPTSASQSARITGVSHHTLPEDLFFYVILLYSLFFFCYTSSSEVPVQNMQACYIDIHVSWWFAESTTASSTLGISPNAIPPLPPILECYNPICYKFFKLSGLCFTNNSSGS